jgi:hypothetical protein
MWKIKTDDPEKGTEPTLQLYPLFSGSVSLRVCTNGGTQTEGVWGRGAKGNIWT